MRASDCKSEEGMEPVPEKEWLPEQGSNLRQFD